MQALFETATLWVVVFVLNVAETVIATLEMRHDRLSGRPGGLHKHSVISASYAAVFEVVLMVGTILIVSEDKWLLIPSVLGAFGGKYYSLEQRRRKLNEQRFKRGEKRKANAVSPDANRMGSDSIGSGGDSSAVDGT